MTSITDSQRELITKHLDLVIEANNKVNLTRIENIEEAKILHIEDSLSALSEMENAPAGLYGDLGSGAGYPGIPLAIATGRTTVLVDARKKKMEVVEEIVRELGLSNQVTVFAGRAELLARTRASQFSVLTARALSKLSVLMELASPLLSDGGHLICFKSNIEEEEMNHALAIQRKVGMRLISDRSFTLGEEYARRIVVFERHGKPAVKLPRLEGQAQKNPL